MKITMEGILTHPQSHINNPVVADPLHLYDCCPVSDGAAAVLLTTEEIGASLGKPVVEIESRDAIPHGVESILFIDDEQPIADMMGTMLGRVGYQVKTITNPVEALELFKSNPDAFDLVITDMTMPKMTGIQLAEKLKRIRMGIPVVISTGYSPVADEKELNKLVLVYIISLSYLASSARQHFVYTQLHLHNK